MPERWLQIKEDPSIRAQLFQQQRIESIFDTSIDRIHEIVRVLLTQKGVLHAKFHYSSSQLTFWFASGPFGYDEFVREEVLTGGFLETFSEYESRGPNPTYQLPGH